MQQSSENSLYAQFCAFMQNFTPTYEEGVLEKIRILLQSEVENQHVKIFHAFFNEQNKHYCIEIQMQNFTIADIWETFRILHQGIELGMGLYVMKETDHSQLYILTCLRENTEGICCEIDFIS